MDLVCLFIELSLVSLVVTCGLYLHVPMELVSGRLNCGKKLKDGFAYSLFFFSFPHFDSSSVLGFGCERSGVVDRICIHNSVLFIFVV